MNIETGRMIIRDFTMNDINDMQDILGDAETMKNCEPAYTIEKTADFLQNNTKLCGVFGCRRAFLRLWAGLRQNTALR